MNPLQAVRSTLLLAFMGLPMLIISFVAFLAVGLGNLSFFVLLLGHILVVPTAAGGSHALFDLIYKKRIDAPVYVPASDVGMLVPSATRLEYQQNVAPSWWMAHVVFFMSYLLTNAISVYSLAPEPKASDWMIENRKAKAASIIAVLLLVTVALTWLRYTTGTETMLGILVAFVLSGGLGVGWYKFAEFCGARHADVFGVVQQMLTANAQDDVPMTCVYAPRP